MGLSRPRSGAGHASGLASLLEKMPDDTGIMSGALHSRKMDAVTATAFVIGEEDCGSITCEGGTRVDYDAVAAKIGSNIAALASLPDAEAQEASPSGRLGPPDVILAEVRGSCVVRDGTRLLSQGNFSTVRGNVAVFKGKWMYEVQLGSSGILQIGWTPPNARFTTEQGVGDSPDSYAYDGKRQRRWSVTAAPYGERWAAGDIITCALDLDSGNITYWRNGRSLGVAFESVQRRTPGMAYFPGISLSYAERCEVNFGTRPFVYPQEGFRALQAPPPACLLAEADLVHGCLQRLLDVTAPRPARATTPRGAAALAVARAMPAAFPISCGSDEEGGDEASPHAELGYGQLGHPSAGDIDLDLDLNSSGSPRASPLDSPVVEKLKLGALHLDDPHEAVSTANDEDLCEPALSPTQAMLLASVLAPYIGKVCRHEYVVEAALAPLFKAALELEDGAALDRLLCLLCSVLEPAELIALASTLCTVLGRAVASCNWESEKLPESAAMGALSLWERTLRFAPWRDAWLQGRWWREELETLLTVRQPSAGHDLNAALPHLLWRDGDDYSTVLSGTTRDGEFYGDIAGLDQSFRRLEEMHAALLTHLVAAWPGEGVAEVESGQLVQRPWSMLAMPTFEQLKLFLALDGQPLQTAMESLGVSGERAGSGVSRDPGSAAFEPTGTSTSQVAVAGSSDGEGNSAPGADELRDEGPGGSAAHKTRLADAEVILGMPTYLSSFLSWLIAKNAGARRNVPPPGLSPGSVLVSTFFALLRMLRPFLDAVHLGGDGFCFPSMAMLCHAGLSVGPQGRSIGDEPRLGGTWTHLIKNCLPKDEAEAASVAVPATRRRSPWLAQAPALAENAFEAWATGCNGHWWLLDRALSLYHLGVSPRMRLGFTHLATLEQALASLQQMADRLEVERNASGRTLLRMSIEELQKTVVESLRQYSWHTTWLLEGWKQESCLAVAAVVARLIQAIADREGPLLSFVPELYLDSALDMMHCARRTEHRVWQNLDALDAFGLDSTIACTVSLCVDRRIVSPDARGMLVQTIWALLREEECVPAVAHNPTAREDLMTSLCELLADERFWVQVANTLSLLLESWPGFAFIYPVIPVGLTPEDSALRTNALAARKNILYTIAKDSIYEIGPFTNLFMNALFDRINWAVTELLVVVEELDTAGSEGRGAVQVHRRAAATVALCYGLLRLAEFICHASPHLILGKGQGMFLTRLAEIVAYGLRQLGPGSKAEAIVARKGSAQAVTREADRRLRSTVCAELLAPYLGIIAVLQIEGRVPSETPPKYFTSEAYDDDEIILAAQSLAPALAQQGLPASVVEASLEYVLARTIADESASTERPLYPPDAKMQEFLQNAINALRDAARGQEGGPGLGDSGEDDRTPPDEFLDPIMQTIMMDPVVLPHSGVTVDRETIQRHLLSSATDPFSRAPLSAEELRPDDALKAQIEEWMAEGRA